MTLDTVGRPIPERYDEIKRTLTGYVPRKLCLDSPNFDPMALREDFLWRAGLAGPATLNDVDLWKQNVLVVGEAHSGKSSILRRAFVSACDAYLAGESEVLPVWIDLGLDRDDNHSIDSLLIARLANRGTRKVRLFLDSIDEPLRVRGSLYLNRLRMTLTDVSHCMEGIVAASRRWAHAQNDLPSALSAGERKTWTLAEGSSELVTAKAAVLPAGALTTWTPDFLEREVYGFLLPDEEQLRAFQQALAQRGLEDVLSRPRDGFRLARDFAGGRELPPTRWQLLEERVDRQLELHSPELAATPTLRRLAEVLAIVGTFCGRTSWTERDALNDLTQLSARSGLAVKADDVRLLLLCPLFRSSETRFAFSNDQDREFLAASVLKQVPLRKQLLLLRRNDESNSIRAPHRGVAAHVASDDEDFSRYLLEHDPLCGLLTESVGPEFDERLLVWLFEKVVTDGLYPWQPLPPSDVRLERLLFSHRPADPGAFLKSRLLHTSELSRLWAATAANVWNATAALNETFVELALRSDEQTTIRIAAVDAILRTRDSGSLKRLKPLEDSRDDQVRGHYIRAYRRLAQPTAPSLLSLFRGGEYEKLVGLLQLEASSFAEGAAAGEIPAVLRQLNKEKAAYGKLWTGLMRSTLYAATRTAQVVDSKELLLVLDAIPQHYGLEEPVGRYLKHVPGAMRSLLEALLRRLPPRGSDLHRMWEFDLLMQRFAPFIDGTITPVLLDLPSTPRSLRLKNCILQMLLTHNPSEEYLRQLKTQFGSATDSLVVPRIQEPTLPLQDRIAAVLEQALSTEVVAARLYKELIASDDFVSSSRPLERLPAAFSTLPDGQRAAIAETFTAFVDATQPTVLSLGGRQWTERAVENVREQDMFFAAASVGAVSSTETLARYLGAFGFGDDELEAATLHPLAEELRLQEPQRWQTVVETALAGPNAADETLRYLQRIGSDYFLDRARDTLQSAQGTAFWLQELVAYWTALSPTDLRPVLLAFYHGLRTRYKKRRRSEEVIQYLNLGDNVLRFLLDEGMVDAWDELDRRLTRKDPLAFQFRFDHVPSPTTPRAVKILGKWFRLAVSTPPPPNDWYELPAQILRAMRGGDRQTVLLEFESLRRRVPPEYRVLVDRHRFELMASQSEDTPRLTLEQAGNVAFTQTQHAVFDEQSLQEVVVEALEREKQAYLAGEGVEAYWNHDKRVRTGPKDERLCQNTLWHNLRTRLEQLGITNVRERLAPEGYADFWCEVPQMLQDPIRLPIELKIARKGEQESWYIGRMRTQLYEKYLKPFNLKRGVFVLLWYKTEGYSHPKLTKEEAFAKLEALKRDLFDEHAVTIEPVLVDVTQRTLDTTALRATD